MALGCISGCLSVSDRKTGFLYTGTVCGSWLGFGHRLYWVCYTCLEQCLPWFSYSSGSPSWLHSFITQGTDVKKYRCLSPIWKLFDLFYCASVWPWTFTSNQRSPICLQAKLRTIEWIMLQTQMNGRQERRYAFSFMEYPFGFFKACFRTLSSKFCPI